MANDVEKRISAKFVLDSTGFNDSIKGINSNLKLVQSEFKASNENLKLFGTTTDKLKATSESLGKQIELQAQKVAVYRKSIEDTTEKLQANIKTRDNLKKNLDEEKTKYNEVVKLYGRESEEATKAKESVDKLTEEYKKKEKQIESNAKSINKYTNDMNNSNAELSRLRGELKSTNSELDKHENKWIIASNSLEAASSKMKNAGDKLTGIGTKLSIGVTAPIVAIGAAATKMAMDAVESENLFEVSMGDMADSAREWSEETSKALGLNAYNVRKNVATYNAMLTSMGLTNEESLNMSENMTQLSYDMASFYNLKPEEAFEKLRAGISGESEPLKQLGILVNETTVQQYALANGIAKTNVNMVQAKKAAIDVEKAQIKYNDAVKLHGKNSLEARDAGAKLALEQQQYEKALAGSKVELTENEKVQARYGLIIQATSKAQGDLSRTLDSPTNKLRIQKEQLAQTAIELGDKLIPLLSQTLDVIKPIVEWFGGLTDSQQELIIKFGLLAAATGPVITGIGNIVNVGSSLVGIGSKIAGALGTASLAAEGAGAAAGVAGTGGLATLGGSLGAAAVAAAPFLLAAAAVAGTGYLIYKGMNEEAVPAVDLFADKMEVTAQKVTDSNNAIVDSYQGVWNATGSTASKVQDSNNKISNSYTGMATTAQTSTNTLANGYQGVWNTTQTTTIKISEATQKAVGAYMKMNDDTQKTLNNMYVNSTKITSDTANALVNNYKNMGEQIKTGMDADFNDEYNLMQEFYKNSNALSTDAENKSLEGLKKNNEEQKKSIDEYTKQVENIMQNAAKNNRELTSTEQQEINSIQEKMKITAVKTLSDGEVESKIIMERLKSYGERITAEQASAEIKNANKAKDDTIKAANEKYDKTVAAIIRERDETHTLSADQADKLIKEADRQRKESIDHAEELKEGVIERITNMNREVTNSVDISTGNMLTFFQRMVNGVKQTWEGWNPSPKSFQYSVNQAAGTPLGGHIPENASGTNYFQGGLTTLHERGYEVYNLPTGTRIYNHEASEDLVKQTAIEVAKGMSGKNVTINVDTMVVQDKGSMDMNLAQLQFLSAL